MHIKILDDVPVDGTEGELQTEGKEETRRACRGRAGR
jgi:hypothetical protein